MEEKRGRFPADRISSASIAAFAIPFTLLAELIRGIFGQGSAGRYDWMLLGDFHRLSTPALDKAMLFFTFLGSVKFYAVFFPLVLAALAWRRRWWELNGLFCAFAGALALNNLLKLIIHRIRPNLYLIKETGYSFPSGHAMLTLVFYGILVYFVFQQTSSRKWRAALVVFSSLLTLAVGVSRIYLGVHYPSDVVGAYLAGAGWLAVSILIIRLLRPVHDKTHTRSI